MLINTPLPTIDKRAGDMRTIDMSAGDIGAVKGR